MYGRVDPGARQPYRCTVRENGISPGCKFLFSIFISFHLILKKQLILFTRTQCLFGNLIRFKDFGLFRNDWFMMMMRRRSH